MVGILLMTHAPLGQAFLAAVSHVFRVRPERMEVIDVVADQNPAEINSLARAAIARLDAGDGVLVLTDVMGGTPSNCTLPFCSEYQVQVIAGISLPMLLRAITYRNEPLDVVSQMALEGGQGGACRVDARLRAGAA